MESSAEVGSETDCVSDLDKTVSNLTGDESSVKNESMVDQKPTVPEWEDESLTELERWNLGGEAVDEGRLEFEELLAIADGFTQETKEIIKAGARMRACQSGLN